MASDSSQQRILIAVGITAAFVLLAWNPLHYWDEYFYLYSVLAHEPAALVAMEAGLGGLFPAGFFSGKLGFIYMLDWVVDITGSGEQALFIIHLYFSLLTMLTALACYALLVQILPARNALAVTIIVLFSPLLLYFNGKVLTEIPSLLFAILATVSFLKSFSTDNHKRFYWLLLATILLFFAIWLRFIVVVFYAGMILGLFAMQDNRYPFWKVFWRAAATGCGSVILLVAVWFLMLDDPLGSISGLLGNLANRSQGIIIRIYAVVMFGQLFGLYILASIGKAGTATFRLAVTWLLFTSVPFLIGSSYAEPRFFYMALVPFSILVWQGMQVLAERLPNLFAGHRGWLVFAIVVIINRVLFVPLMPSEHDQHAYQSLFENDYAATQGEVQYLTPWVSDYCLLRFTYPEQAVRLVMDWAYNGDEDFFQSEDFRQWVGDSNYLANFAALARYPQPWHYIGWDYSPVIKRIQSIASALGMPVDSIKEGQKNHLELGWPWDDPALERSQQSSDGHYSIYSLKPASPVSVK